MRVLAVLALVLATAPAFTQALEPANQASPARLSLHGPQPDPMPAGADQLVPLTVHRETGDRPLRGPGWVDLTLEEGQPAGCRLASQRITLDPATGEGHTNLSCQPQEPGTWPMHVRADSPTSRPDTWQASLEIQPDSLVGELATGDVEAYGFPVNLTLAPEHLDEAEVTVRLEARLAGTSLGFQPEPVPMMADGSTLSRNLTALQGAGTYELTAEAVGPSTRDWAATTALTVPEPSGGDTLAIDVEIRAADATVELVDDPINDDGKRKAPGDELTTRLRAEGTDHVNVTVLRDADGQPVALAHAIVGTDEQGRAEHVFAHEPLPAGTVRVQAQAGGVQVERNASIQDRGASGELAGPAKTPRGAHPWTGNLTLKDPNFGSTPLDPGPLQGLPDVDWTVYKGSKWGSVEAEGFAVEIGGWSGASNGTAGTNTLRWPEADGEATVEDGWARLPVRLHAALDVELRDYRLSVYENATGDLLTTVPFELYELGLEALGEPRAGRAWPIQVTSANLDETANLELRLARDNETLANATLTQAGTWRPTLPSHLPAGTRLTVEAHAHGAGFGPTSEPDARLARVMADRGAELDVHPVLDGVPTTTPLTLHPAHAHEVEIAYHAYDANTGALDVSRVELTGPEGPPGWPLEQPEEGRLRLEIPQGIQPGRYALQMHLDDDAATVKEIGIEVGEIVRLAVQGPEQLQLVPGEPESVDVTVTNRGTVPIEGVRLLLDTDLSITAQARDADGWVDPDRSLPLGLEPGASASIPIRLEAHSPGAEGRVELTLVGVLS